MADIKRVMISSTARDLPEHRKEVMDACLSQGMFPSMMEHLSASDADAVEVSLRMVDGADIYVGVIAHRYGYIPANHDLSITEMEYQRAVERGIPRLIFLIHASHPQDNLLFEDGAALDKLEDFKSRLQTEQVVNYYRSPQDLRAHVINSLSHYRLAGTVAPDTQQFSTPIKAQMALVNKAIDSLTQEQYQVLNMLRYQRRVAIAGCAGSGKTLIAAEKAVRLDQAGFRTLVLCHSWYLAQYIRRLVSGTGVMVQDFTSWIHQIIGGTEEHSGGWNHYEEPLNDDLTAAFDKLSESNERYDAIIVDEGQDFRELWWTIIESALVSADYGILYVFHDDNQALLPSRAKYPLVPAPVVLSKNCRNTGEVFELVKKLHPQSPATDLSLRDQGVVKQWAYSPTFRLTDERQAAQYVTQEALTVLAPDQLVVLTTEPEPVENSVINGLEVALRPKWRWQDVVTEYIGAELDLSNEPFPNEQDIQTVQQYASQFFPPEWESSRMKNLKWRATEDSLSLTGFLGKHYEWVRGFFISPQWAEGIPRPATLRIEANPDPSSPAGGGGGRRGSIPLYTIAAFKGLESEGVVLFIPSNFAGQRHELEANVYVGMSRARFLLYMVVDKEMTMRIPQVMLKY